MRFMTVIDCNWLIQVDKTKLAVTALTVLIIIAHKQESSLRSPPAAPDLAIFHHMITTCIHAIEML